MRIECGLGGKDDHTCEILENGYHWADRISMDVMSSYKYIIDV
jgi:hypothetical protein